MNNNKKSLLISLLVIVIAGIIGIVGSVIDFSIINKTLSYSYEVIQFDYDGASDGLDPNGDSFNAVDFLTDEVIMDGLARQGLQDKYNIDDIRHCILMENVVPKQIVEEINSFESLINDEDSRVITSSDYHSVRYRFVLYHDIDKKLSKNDLNKLLDNIIDAYCDAFYNTYKINYDVTNYNDLYDMESYDYIYQSAVFRNKIRILSNNARRLHAKHEDFKVNDKSFNDIALKCDQLISSDISRINNIIILNALSKDIDRLKDYYNYKIENLNFEKTKYTSDLNNINAQVAAYTKNPTVYVGTGENVVKVDGNSSATYDNLLARQISISNIIASITKEINDYQSILEDINNATGTDADRLLVENYITKLSNDYNTLEESFNGLLVEYNNEYIFNNSISREKIDYHSNSIISTSFIVKCIKVCAPIVLVALLGISIYYLIRETKKNKVVME
ncbi:MAG: hypothetical protein J6X93_06375 [Bacilli bacterium]|nr:hypothetical protein [Bacilli bacterium]